VASKKFGSQQKDKAKTNIAIAVSFGTSSGCVCKIVSERTRGSTVELTQLVGVTRDGMNYIPDRFWKETFGINGLKATVERMVIGNDTR
jgi:hypothetical protein